MLKTISLLSAMLLSSLLPSQEFTRYKNGLIYSEGAMNRLIKVVDSLNLKYKTCDMSKVFHSQLQTVGYSVKMESGNVSGAKKDMDRNIPIEDFIKKYPEAIIKKDLLIIKSKEKDYHKNTIIEIREIPVEDEDALYIEFDYTKELYNRVSKNKWAYNYKDKKSYSDEKIYGFFFPENFKSVPLDPKYSRQIIYSDCLIDTPVSKFKEDAKSERFGLSVPQDWKKLSKLEKEKLLDELRSVEIIGGCSQDPSPRMQGIYMALLSAETGNWEMFLKSHLDIVNDRFERVADSGYARERRGTYIKELETLNINVPDLLFGTAFRIENPVHNHYFGNVSRLGKAVSESKDVELFLSQLLSMIGDKNLDDYNRIVSYFFYLNCNYYIKNKRERKINTMKLTEAIKRLPKYLTDQIKIENIQF
ncbi:MAG: hypothetical protein LBE92_12365 [Chryseobacterium sp.]|jgi:hypothetical protein|uniref:hypothetical protein n=1 Tax=Chryseobacterium sp. TaxID=1871047 RepID=UPI0028216F3B|nr:hypothetical protein [Chryseobacterium sp.]MDR2236910.1 hypothetical protein [Chryseobacterium sp.]